MRLVLVIALQLMLVGCNDKDNPLGPKKLPQYHYPNCMNRCTAIRPGQVHQRR